VLGKVWFRGHFWVLWIFYVFEFFLALLYHFSLVYHFSCLFIIFVVFPSSRWIFELFLAFGLLTVLHGVLGSLFKLCPFCCQWTHQVGRLRNQVVSILVWYVMSHWHVEVWIRIWDISVVLPFIFVRVENHVCLSRGVQVTGAAWQAAMRIVIGVGDLV
jgi:hypothetical protein